MEGTMKKGIAAAIAALVIAGCATGPSKSVVDKDTMSSFKAGVTTIADVEAKFGQPFQESKEPDGTDKLQYLSKVKVPDTSMPTVGSNIPRQIVKNVSAMLVFDEHGKFVHAWTTDKTVDENVPGNMGRWNQGDVTRGSMYSRLAGQ
jgi:hypothetical protein